VVGTHQTLSVIGFFIAVGFILASKGISQGLVVVISLGIAVQ
jgi:hypothetical protein